MSYLKSNEKETAIELLTKGYEKAALSFAIMTKQQIKIKPTRIEIVSESDDFFMNLKKDNELILLETSIIGEHDGKSYLLFNNKEANEVYKTCMPYNSDEASRQMETEALLKELDNILSAAVITEFSNYMKATIFGDVPVIIHTKRSALKRKLFEDMQDGKNDYFLLADTQFVFENDTTLCPQFIWKLTKGFVDGIKGRIDVARKKAV